MLNPAITALRRSLLPFAMLALLPACGISHARMDEYAKDYFALADHKAMFFNEDNDRFVWASDKGSQLDAIQLAQILCTHSSSEPEDCKLIFVDNHQVYDPVNGVVIAPDSSEIADILYEGGFSKQPGNGIHPEPVAQTPDGSSKDEPGLFGRAWNGITGLFGGSGADK